MYCLKLKVIGCDDALLPHVRREILNHGGIVDGEFPNAGRAVREVRMGDQETYLFIVHVKSTEELSDLKLLSGSFVGQPIIALIDTAQNPTLVVKAMRAGARQVVPLPFSTEDFGEALDCIGVQYAGAARHARTIAVAGATGGCGGTSIAVNLGFEIAQRQQGHCILVELSLRMGVLAAQLDVRPRYTTYDLLVNADRMDTYVVQQALTSIGEYFSILPGPYECINPGTVSAEGAFRMIDLTRNLADVVVLDVPCTYDELFFGTLSKADIVLLVVEQNVSSVRGARMVCEALKEQRPHIIVNRYNSSIEGFTANRLHELLQPRELWTVAIDPVVTIAANNGRTLRLQDHRSRALADIDKIVQELFREPGQPGPKAGSSSFFRRLGRALSLSQGGVSSS